MPSLHLVITILSKAPSLHHHCTHHHYTITAPITAPSLHHQPSLQAHAAATFDVLKKGFEDFELDERCSDGAVMVQ